MAVVGTLADRLLWMTFLRNNLLDLPKVDGGDILYILPHRILCIPITLSHTFNYTSTSRVVRPNITLKTGWVDRKSIQSASQKPHTAEFGMLAARRAIASFGSFSYLQFIISNA